MNKLLLILSLMALSASSAFAASTCVGDVSAFSGGATCVVDGFEIGNFDVTPVSGSGVSISFGSGTTIEGDTLVLQFDMIGGSSTDVVQIDYEVVSTSEMQFTGIDLQLPTTSATALEMACVIDCDSVTSRSDILGTIAALTPGNYDSSFYNPTSSLWVQNTIQFGSNNFAMMSRFSTARFGAAPEPGTGLLLGSALLGLAAWRRHKQKSIGKASDL